MLSLSDVVQVNVVGGVVFEFHLSVDGGLGLRVSRIYPSIVHVQDEDTPVPLEIMFVAVALGYKTHTRISVTQHAICTDILLYTYV